MPRPGSLPWEPGLGSLQARARSATPRDRRGQCARSVMRLLRKLEPPPLLARLALCRRGQHGTCASSVPHPVRTSASPLRRWGERPMAPRHASTTHRRASDGHASRLDHATTGVRWTVEQPLPPPGRAPMDRVPASTRAHGPRVGDFEGDSFPAPLPQGTGARRSGVGAESRPTFDRRVPRSGDASPRACSIRCPRCEQGSRLIPAAKQLYEEAKRPCRLR